MEFAPLGHARVSKHQTPREAGEFLDQVNWTSRLFIESVLGELPDPAMTVHHRAKAAGTAANAFLTS